MNLNSDKINVLNYNENIVSAVVSPTKTYIFEASEKGAMPTVVPMTFDEIIYLNNTNAFKSGLLTFEDDKKEEIYTALGISDWENILSNEDIRNIILSPTYEGLVKIVNIKDSGVFERVRGIYHKLRTSNEYDISMRVAQIIETRYKELKAKKAKSSIIISKKDIPQNNDAEIDSLKAELAEMKELVAKLTAAQTKASVAETKNETAPKPARKPGRPSTKKTGAE